MMEKTKCPSCNKHEVSKKKITETFTIGVRMVNIFDISVSECINCGIEFYDKNQSIDLDYLIKVARNG